MNIPPRPQSDDEATDRLLTRRYRDTSTEFEARWVDLKRALRQTSPDRPRWFPSWRLTGWLGAIGAVAAMVLVLQTTRPPANPPPVSPPAVPVLSPQLADLFAMDAVLNRALPLLDKENRTVLLHLAANDQPSN